MVDLNRPRETGRAAVKACLTEELWNKNWSYCDQLKEIIKRHKLYRHPVIGVLNTETLNKEISRTIHFEFAYAFAQIFTDSLIVAMARTADLEKRLGPRGKVSARFLLQLNLLDELGYKPATSITGDYCGNPALAHYMQFAQTLKDLGGKAEDIFTYKPSAAAVAARKTFEETYHDYTLSTAVLACAETVFTLFAGPWARSTSRSAGLDIAQGYHSIHVEDESGEFIDDDHSEDSWYLFAQAITPERYEEILEQVEGWLDTWYDFGDQIVHIARTLNRQDVSREVRQEV